MLTFSQPKYSSFDENNTMVKKCFFLILPFLLLPYYSHAESFGDYQGAIYVRNYDGDTITFNLSNLHPIIGEKISIRVNGIDTPEIRGKCEKEKHDAQQAKEMVANILKDAEQIVLRNMERGKYFRFLEILPSIEEMI